MDLTQKISNFDKCDPKGLDDTKLDEVCAMWTQGLRILKGTIYWYFTIRWKSKKCDIPHHLVAMIHYLSAHPMTQLWQGLVDHHDW